jgi:hypothetical protein
VATFLEAWVDPGTWVDPPFRLIESSHRAVPLILELFHSGHLTSLTFTPQAHSLQLLLLQPLSLQTLPPRPLLPRPLLLQPDGLLPPPELPPVRLSSPASSAA